VEGVFEPTTHKGEFVFPFKWVTVPRIDPETGEQAKDEVTGALLWKEEKVYSKIPFGIRRYADGLLQFLIKANLPEMYRERSAVEVTGAGGGAIEIVERLAAGRKRVAEMKAALERSKEE